MANKGETSTRRNVTIEAVAEAASTEIGQSVAMIEAGAEIKTGAVMEAGAVIKQGVTGAVAGYEKTQNEMKANMDKTVKSAEEIVTFGQGNIEALVKSAQIWAAGMQDLQKVMSATAQVQIEATMGSFKALAGVKSLKEAIDLQTNLARTSLEAAMNETGKLTDASMKLAEQTLAPLTARVTLAAEKFGRAA